MSEKSTGTAEQRVRAIRRATRKQYFAEEKIRIVLEGLRGEQSINELCQREQIAERLYYKLVEGVPGGGQASRWQRC